MNVRLRKRFHRVITSLSLVATGAMALGPGDIAFTGFNADGSDNVAFVALTNLPAGTEIYFNDHPWDGTGFTGSESEWKWTAPGDGVPAGMIVHLDNVGVAGIGASTGTVAFTISANLGLSATAELLYAFTGTSSNPATFLAAIGNVTNDATGSLLNTGLTNGIQAIRLHSSGGIDIGAYAGPRTGLTALADYRTQVNASNNWVWQEGSGDQSIDTLAPDVPFSGLAFEISGGPALPGIDIIQPANGSSVTTTSAVIAIEIAGANLTGDVVYGNLTTGNFVTNPVAVTSAVLPFVYGSNVLTVSGTNAAGSAGATAIVHKLAPAPYLAIESPTNGFVTTSSIATITVTVVSSNLEGDVVFANVTAGFLLTNSPAQTSAVLPILYGTNVLTVTGANATGAAVTVTSIVERLAYPPFIAITNPVSGSTLLTDNDTIQVAILSSNLTGQVIFANATVGAALTNTATQKTATLPLDYGTNVFVVTGSNVVGQSVAVTSVIERLVGAPLVDIVSPASGSVLTGGQSLVVGLVRSNLEGTITVSNQTTGIAYTIPSTAGSQLIPTTYGTNVIVAIGSNVLGVAAADTVTVVRLHGDGAINLQAVGRIALSGAEISAYDGGSKRAFVTSSNGLRVISLTNIYAPSLISVALPGTDTTSADAHYGLIAVAAPGVTTNAGQVVFLDANGTELHRVTVGVLPDMVAFTPNGLKVVVANEAETGDHADWGDGSVSVIDLSAGLTNATVTNLNFAAYDTNVLRSAGVRILPNRSAAQDIEPEYVAISPDGLSARVTLQENNALAFIDLTIPAITNIVALGYKDHNLPGNGLDSSDQDGPSIRITNRPVRGLYMPDAIASFAVGGQTYYMTANEGDTRDFAPADNARVSTRTLDTNAFPNAVSIKSNSVMGRLTISTVDGDTDGDGDYDVLYAFGSRSFSIWNSAGTLVYDSGDQFERITAAQTPTLFNTDNGLTSLFDTRSDNKGPEPEGVTVGVIDGRTYAFVCLERAGGGVMIYDVTVPTAPLFVQYCRTDGDISPEGIRFVPAAASASGKPLLLVTHEVSNTLTIYEIDFGTTLQLLHASDLEGAVEAIQNAPNFAAVVQALESDAASNGIPSLLVSAGDNLIPGPFYSAAGDAAMRSPIRWANERLFGLASNSLPEFREANGRVDATIMNLIGVDASCFGNHEFDLGTQPIRDWLTPNSTTAVQTNIQWLGVQFPYLSANLSFSSNSDLSAWSTTNLWTNTQFASTPAMLPLGSSARKIAPATIVVAGTQRVGVVGATTPLLASISSPGTVGVKNPGAGSNDMDALASILQPYIDGLIAQGVDKVVLVTHLQQFALETNLVTKLRGVDVIVSGGSDTLLADATDHLRASETADGVYPYVSTNADGDPAVVVSMDGHYKYLGRLVVAFTTDGVIVPGTVNPAVSGAFATDDTGVTNLWGSLAAAFASDTTGDKVKDLVDAVQSIVISKDTNLLGYTSVFLDGRRTTVRTQESNLGDMTADANLFVAQGFDSTVKFSHKNGGGIREQIGYIDGLTGVLYPPQTNSLSGKPTGGISQLDVENSLRFNNKLSLVTLTASQVWRIVEHAVAATTTGATPGQFGQVAGLAYSFDPNRPANARVESLGLSDSAGNITEAIVHNAALVGDPNRPIRGVTLDFLANGGDSYPYATFIAANTGFANRVDLAIAISNVPGTVTFAAPGTEQDALAEYIRSNFAVVPFALAETPITLDQRIRYLTAQPDLVFAAPDIGSIAPVFGTNGAAFTIDVIPYLTYRAEVTTNLLEAPVLWQTIAGPTMATNGTWSISDGVDRGPMGVYRLIQE